MIPILYAETEQAFTNRGLGGLSDAITCTVTEERNGIYELYMQYPADGKHFDDIKESRIISAVPADGKRPQPFRIYRITKPLNGICEIYAEHISYQLNSIPVMPFTAGSVTEALNGLITHSAQDNPFTVWTDKSVAGNYTLDHPETFRALLGGVQGSILDVYGTGEYEFDQYLVRLWLHRGYDTGVTIRYGKNLVDLSQDSSIADTITGVCPYWLNAETGALVTLPEKAIWSEAADNYPYKRTRVLDFTSDFEEEPTVDQLRTRAQKYIKDNNIGIPKTSITVEFVPLWQMNGVSIGTPQKNLVIPGAEIQDDTLTNVNGYVEGDILYLNDASWSITYDDYKVLERVNLCDTVTVVYDKLGVSATAKIIKTVYNVLKDRYDSMEIGDAKTNLADTINGISDQVSDQVQNEISSVRTWVDHQTQLITGGLGGNVVLNYNAAGQPYEILIMDSAEMATAVHVLRMNVNGIGFSQNGYNGPYTSAWTLDGVFNADFIQTGTLNANLITTGTMLADRLLGGTLRLGGQNNQNGTMQVYSQDDLLYATLTTDGMTMTSLEYYNASGGNYGTAGAKYQRRTMTNAGSYNLYYRQVTDSNGNTITPIDTKSGTISAIASGGMRIDTEGVIFVQTPTPNGETAQYLQLGNYQYSSAEGTKSQAMVHYPFLTVTGAIHYIGSGFYTRGTPSAGFNIYYVTDNSTVTNTGNLNGHEIVYVSTSGQISCGHVTATGLTVTGTKNRAVETDHYNERLLYCYETPSPLFGDVGEGVIGEDGNCYISIDPIFAETITTSQYQVFLQKYGDGDCYVAQRQAAYFIVKGTPGLSFGWELKAKQKDFDQMRMERQVPLYEDAIKTIDYATEAGQYLKDLGVDYVTPAWEHMARIDYEEDMK